MLELYVKDGCPHCRKQIDELERLGASYQLHNVSSDPEALKRAKKDFRASKVPVLVEDGEVKTIGFEGMG